MELPILCRPFLWKYVLLDVAFPCFGLHVLATLIYYINLILFFEVGIGICMCIHVFKVFWIGLAF